MKTLTDLLGNTPIVKIHGDSFENVNLYAKLESYNPSGSVKDRAADYVLSTLLRNGEINEKTTIIESSSGNFAIALAVFCKKYKLKFVCVIDPNISFENEQILKNLNVNIIKVCERDESGGFLLSRIKVVKEFLKNNENSYWINQYANPYIVEAYHNTLGEEICNDELRYDYIFIGVSSCGTIAGVSQKVKEKFPNTKIIAVDIEGSVIFGGKAEKRYIPGIGSSMIPENLKRAIIDDRVTVTEKESIEECKRMLKDNCMLVGGSSGSAVAAVKKYLKRTGREIDNCNILLLFPDRGERYCGTIYNEDWCNKIFGE